MIKKLILKIVLLVIVFMVGLSASSQEVYDFPTINKKTYDDYLSKNWKELVEVGKKAKKAGIDFYYLQARMGIAYYEMKKYRQAIPYLEQALSNSSDNRLIEEYLYFAYLFAGRSSDAQKLASKLPKDFRKKAGINFKTGITAVGFDTKFDTWDDYGASVASTDTLIQDVQKGYNYFGISIEGTLKNSSKVMFGFSRIGISNDYNSLNSSDVPIEGNSNISQNQLIVQYSTNIAKGLNLYLSGSMLFIKSDGLYQSESGSGGSGFGGGGSTTITRNSSTINSEFIGYTAISKDISLFKFGFFSSVSNLDGNFQVQPGISLTVYPLGNRNLYFYSTLNYQFENKSAGSVSRTISKNGTGIGLFGVYIEPAITIGELHNLIEAGGLVVNNTNDVVKDRFELTAYTWLLKGKLNLFLKYQNYLRTNNYYINNISYSLDYNYQSMIGGIRWNF